MVKSLRSIVLVFVLAVIATPALASQGSCVMPTTGTVSGLTLVNDINACHQAIQSMNSGASAPSSPYLGELWLDTNTNTVDVYDGAQWVPLGVVDASTHIWNSQIGGGIGTVSSSTTTDLCSVAPSVINITGTTAISSFSNTCKVGQIKSLLFSSVLTLTYNSTSMILPSNGLNILTAPNDRAWVVYLGSGNWELLAYQRADGSAVNTASVFTGPLFLNSPITASLSTNTNDWSPSGFTNANVIRLSSTSTVTLSGIVAPTTDGRRITLYNVGSNNVVLTSQDGSSIAANRFAFQHSEILRPNASIVLLYDLTSARWRLDHAISPQGIAGGYKNLRIINSGSAARNITADEITLEDSNGAAVRVSSVNVSPDLTVSGANGLDSGTRATSTWYSEWVIYNPTTNTVAGLLSTNATTPTLPSGYTFMARVGWDSTISTSAIFNLVSQFGNKARYVVSNLTTTTYPQVFIGTSGSNFPYSIREPSGAFVPSTASSVDVILNNPNNNTGALSCDNNAYTNQSSANSVNPTQIWAAWAYTLPATITFAGTDDHIYCGSNSSTATVNVFGWADNL